MKTTLKDFIPERNYLDGKLVFAGGCFDVVHEGHIDYLEFAKAQGDHLIVGIVSDDRVRQRKGAGRPILSEGARLRIIDSIRFVDYTFIMPLPKSNMSPTINVVTALRPESFVLYADSSEKYGGDLDARLKKLGTKLIIDEGLKKNSSSDIINRARQTK